MSDWVHCNRCSEKFNAQTTFFLAECGHIFCQKCVEKIKLSKKCSLCDKSGKVLPLNKDVDQHILDFFLPLDAMLKKCHEVYKFQLQHRNTLYQNLLGKYNYTKKEYITCYNASKQLIKENQTLRSMLRSAGKSPQGFSTSTPVSLNSDNVTFQNTSMMSSIATKTPNMFKDYSMKMFPGYPKMQPFSSRSSQSPSPAQRVPMGYSGLQERAMIHRGSLDTMRSLEELRRKSQLAPNNRN
ncbi:probable E3 SUMO-protein ligase RNF212 [Tribolium castaneum]|uniref:Putative E3 SUMO-protein ligase RNF212-like Protein n=1 Tax=Tribolium castaneum TaxID=7070 RepID=D6X225_TRICA|nr:PREDICTED: probable E3 SUMO-protein ligase RNF212 [Tribolium castaneum]EFA10202.1 putative E3 SUMO-protein ligase RNF212-like Protein [Tribolium castaneum]|eukprot:XP_008197772.1 PREDICTED: probable E3 SUMO-protein ligase RNF212 [Tribolium castaneum]